MSIRTKAELALIGITFIWGTTFAIIKDALARIHSLEFLTLRFLLATVILCFMFWREIRSTRFADCLPGVWIGLILWLSFTFQIKGLEFTTPSKSAFVTGFSVILVPLFNSVLKGRIPSWINLLSAAFALLGLYLLSGTPSFFPMDWGISLTLLCAVGFAFHVIAVDRFARTLSTNLLVVTQIATAALASSALSLKDGLPALPTSLKVWAAIIVTAILATALAFYVQNWAQKYTHPSRTALILSLEPVFAALVSYFTIHEIWTHKMFVGCTLIFAGIITSEIYAKEHLAMESMTGTT